MGDGIAIDPTDDLVRAPCDGDVVSVAPTRHAVTLRALNGAELLIHVGIDTVALGGDEPFRYAAAGSACAPATHASVRSRCRGCRAPSLVTPIIVTNPTGYEVVDRRHGATSAGDALLARRRAARLQASRATPPAKARVRPLRAERDASGVSRRVQVALAHGLHARPAALVARRNRDFDAVAVRARGRAANASSAVADVARRRGGYESMSKRTGARPGRGRCDRIADCQRARGGREPGGRVTAYGSLTERSAAGEGRDEAGVVASRGHAIGRVRAGQDGARGRGAGAASRTNPRRSTRPNAVRRHLESLHAATSGRVARSSSHTSSFSTIRSSRRPPITGLHRAQRGMCGGARCARASMRWPASRMRGCASGPTTCSTSKAVLASLAGEAPGRTTCPKVRSSLRQSCCRPGCGARPGAHRGHLPRSAARRRTSRSWPRRPACR